MAKEESRTPGAVFGRNAELRPNSDRYRLFSFIALGLLAMSAGSGELYGWPRLGSLEGPRALWLFLPAALLQIPVLAECQRSTLLTGRSLYAAIAIASPTLCIISILLTLFSFLWLGGWISGSAAMIAILLGVGPENLKLATNVTTVFLAVVLGWPLFTKKLLAKYVSLVLKVFAVATFLSALLCVYLLPRPGVVSSYLREMFTPHFDIFVGKSPADRVDLILAITFLGLGSWASVLYTTYASLERYGRKSSGSLWNDPQQPDALAPGAISLLTEWRGKIGYWYRHLYLDVSIGIILNLFTTAILTFLAVESLYGSGTTIGRNYDLLSQQARFFEPLLGEWAIPMFIVVGSAFLLDTWIGFMPLMSKGFQEGLQLSIRPLSRFSEERVYQVILFILAAASIITAMLTAPGNLIRWTAVSLNATHPLVIGLLIFVNYIYLPRRYDKAIRPGLLSLGAILICFIAYTAIAIWYLMSLK